MWIFLKDSFLSIVNPKIGTPARAANQLIVRARASKEDILRYFPDAKVQTSRARDYAFRASIDRTLVADTIMKVVLGITATNFKDTVAEKDRAASYLRVWSVMNDLQDQRGHGGLYNQDWTTYGYSDFDSAPELDDRWNRYQRNKK